MTLFEGFNVFNYISGFISKTPEVFENAKSEDTPSEVPVSITKEDKEKSDTKVVVKEEDTSEAEVEGWKSKNKNRKIKWWSKLKSGEDREFNFSRAGSRIGTGLMNLLMYPGLIIFGFIIAIFGGNLASNEGMGYSWQVRFVFFIYGMLVSPFIIIRALYIRFFQKSYKFINYALFPFILHPLIEKRNELEQRYIDAYNLTVEAYNASKPADAPPVVLAPDVPPPAPAPSPAPARARAPTSPTAPAAPAAHI